MLKKYVSFDLGANTTYSEALLSLRLLFFNNTDTNALRRSLQLLAPYVQSDDRDYIAFLDSGRSALLVLLQSLELPRGSEVIIQAFSCIVVPNAVINAGLQPVVCDCNADYSMSYHHCIHKITKKTRVVILQHTFGIISQECERILAVCREKNIFVIEDCAHALGSKYKGRYAGTFGDAAMYSFGRDKVVSTTSGGALVIRHKHTRWHENIKRIMLSLDETPHSLVQKYLMYIIWSVFIVRPCMRIPIIGKSVMKMGKSLGFYPPVYTESEKQFGSQPSPYRYSLKLARIFVSQLNRIEHTLNHMKSISNMYAQNFGKKRQNGNSMRYVLEVDESKKVPLIQVLKKANIILGTWYTTLFLPVRNTNNLINKESAFPNALYMTRVTVQLPTHRLITKKLQQKISTIINDTLKTTKK